MSSNSQVKETISLPTNTTSTGISQVGDKNTQVAHADKIIINNYVVTANPNMISTPVINFDAQSVASKSSITNGLCSTQPQLSNEYYNLFILGYEGVLQGNRFIFPADRVLNEYITKEVSELFPKLLDEATISNVKLLPSIFAYENRLRDCPDQEAYYGFVTDIKIRDNGINIYFQKYFTIPQRRLNDIAHKLAIIDWEFNRTHWTIKKVNLIEELIDAGLITDKSGRNEVGIEV